MLYEIYTLHAFDYTSSYFYSIKSTQYWTLRAFALLPRRVCEAVAFGKTKYDPFERQKKAGLRDCHEGAKMLILKTQNLITSTPRFSKDQQAGVKHALYLGLLGSLWGNQADLSLWPSEVSPSTVGQPSKTPPRPSPQSVDLESEEYGNSMRKLTEYLLADHFQELWNSLVSSSYNSPYHHIMNL